MVTVTVKDGEFQFHGTFDCGYAGLYRDDMIELRYSDVASIRKEGLDGKDLSGCSDDEIAAAVAAFCNAIEANVQRNIRQFNDNFLECLFDALEGCGYPFWEYPDMVDQAFLEAHPDFEDWYDGAEAEFPEPLPDPEKYGSYETALRRTYPCFNFDYYLSHITSHGLSIYTRGYFYFEISDDMDYLCHLVGTVEPDLSFSDWNNG